jgi:DNA-binding NtrC family response regulator
MPAPVRVLLADDEVIYIESLAKVLRKRGLVAKTTYNGVDALAAATNEEFDVIVLDLRMPGLDGLETLRRVRELDPLTPVLLLTGHADVERTTEALKDGATDILLKPCTLDTLLSSIEDAHERKVYAKQAAAETEK